MQQHYQRIIRDTEKRVLYFLKNQLQDQETMHHDGLMNQEQFVDPKATIFLLADLAALYFNPKSRFYQDQKALERVRAALDYEIRVQRPEGTFDYLSCNFQSAPDTAFYTNRLVSLYKVVLKYAADPRYAWLKEKLYQIIEKAGYGMVKGGFHTPNHR